MGRAWSGKRPPNALVALDFRFFVSGKNRKTAVDRARDDCDEVEKPSHCFGVNPPSFINIVEPNEFPAALGQLKNEENRCVFPVVWSALKRAVDLIAPGGFFSRFGASETLRGIGLAFENFKKVAWKKGVGLIEYSMGYGAMADGFRLKRTESKTP